MKDIVLNELAFNFLKNTHSDGECIDRSDRSKVFEFIYIISGSVKTVTNKVTLTAGSGKLLFNPPELSYMRYFYADENGLCETVSISFRYWPNVDEFDFPLQVVNVDDDLRQYIEVLPFNETTVDSRFIWRAYQFLDIIVSYLKKNDNKNALKIQKAVSFMKENDHYSIPDLAKLCNMSECRFYTVFNEVVGMTPVKMKHEIQSTKAEILLKTTNLSIDEIASKVGFDSPAQFRKVFKNRFNVSPKEIRKQLKEQ